MLAVLIRLPWIFLQPTDDQAIRTALPDQFEYLQLARNLLEHGSLHFHDPRFDQDVYAFRMPGYPLFVAALGARPTLVRLAQVLIDASTVLAVYLLARRWLLRRDVLQQAIAGRASGPGSDRETGALLAALLIAVNPWLIYFSGLLLTETLFIAMLAWGMVLLSVRWPDRRRAMLAGIALLALSVYIRPSALPLAALLAVAAALANRPEAHPYKGNTRFILREAALIGVIAAAASVLVLLPWAIRNARHPAVNAWVWTTTNNGITSYDGFHPGATGASDQTFTQAMPELRQMSEVERSAHLAKLARQEIARDPARAAALAVRKVARTWSPMPLSSDYNRLRYILPGLLYTVPFFLLVAVGAVASELSRLAKLLLLLPAIYLTLIHAVSVGSIRYRIPAEPPMAVLAAAAVLKIRSKPAQTEG